MVGRMPDAFVRRFAVSGDRRFPSENFSLLPAYFALCAQYGVFFDILRICGVSCAGHAAGTYPGTPRRAFRLASLHLHQTIEKTDLLRMPAYLLCKYGRLPELLPRGAIRSGRGYVLASLRAYAALFSILCAAAAICRRFRRFVGVSRRQSVGTRTIMKSPSDLTVTGICVEFPSSPATTKLSFAPLGRFRKMYGKSPKRMSEPSAIEVR